jgi:ArsR family transcriptional regulator
MKPARPIDDDVKLLQAAADPTRLTILRQLAVSGATCACDLTGCCGVSQPTTSHHLKVLREAGWITGERRGTWIWYSIRPEAAKRMEAILGQLQPGPGGPVGQSPSRPRLSVLQPA